MGISVDQAKLEDLRKLTAFFEFISNPQSYKDFLAETKAVLTGMEQTIAAHTTVEKAGEYLAAAEAKMAEVNQAVADFNAQQVAAAAEAALKHSADWEEIALTQDKLAADRALLVAQQEAFVAQRVQLDEAQQALAAREGAASIKEAQLVAREREIAETKAKLAALVGG